MLHHAGKRIAYSDHSIATLLVLFALAPVALFPLAAAPIARTTLLNQFPYGLVIDQATGRAFLATAGDPATPFGSPSIAAGARDQVAVFDLATGALLRTVSLGAGPLLLAVDQRAGHVFAASGANSVTMLDATNGEPVHTTALGDTPLAMAVDDTLGRLYVADMDGGLHVIDTHSDAILSTRQVAGGISAIIVDQPAGRLFISGAPYNGAGAMSILDTASGRLLHTLRVGAFSDNPLLDSRHARAFILTHAGNSVSVVDSYTGRLVHTIPVGQRSGPLTLALALDAATGRAFVLNQNNATLMVIDSVSGRVERVLAMKHDPRALVVSARFGRVFVANGDGTVSVLDAHSGGSLRTIALLPRSVTPPFWLPDAVALDDRAGRVFVVGESDESARAFVLSARSGAVLHAISVGSGPHIIAVADTIGRAIVAGGPVMAQDDCGAPGNWLTGVRRLWTALFPGPIQETSAGSVSILDSAR